MNENLTEKEKRNIIKNLFRHYGEEAQDFYYELAIIGEKQCGSFWEAAFQVHKEYEHKIDRDLSKKHENFGEEQAQGLKEMMDDLRKNEKKEANDDITKVFKKMYEDIKNDKNPNRKPLDIKSIKIIQDNDRK